MRAKPKKLGRNAPCHCGSGKKYKQCHLAEDQQISWHPATLSEPIVAPEAQYPPVPMPSPTPAPAAEIITDVWWEEFVDADIEGKVEIFTEKLDDEALVDEDSFEMLTAIRSELDTKHQSEDRVRYAALVQQLRNKKPDLFEHHAHYYQSNLISDAATEGRWDVLGELLGPFVRNLEQGIDEFFVVIDVLMYHGQIRPLISTMFQARDALCVSEDLLDWVGDEFDDELVGLILMDHAQTTSDPQFADSPLQEKLSQFTDLNVTWTERKFTRLAADTPITWQADDFGKAVNGEQWEDNLLNLLFDFMADSRRTGIPLSRSEMAHHVLFSLLKEQTLGSSAHHMRKSNRRRKTPRRRRAYRSSALIPTRSAVDEALASHLRFLNETPYKVAAVTELLPGYLQFLVRMNLISPTEMKKGLNELKPLVPQLVTLLERHRCDMRAIETVKSAWED